MGRNRRAGRPRAGYASESEVVLAHVETGDLQLTLDELHIGIFHQGHRPEVQALALDGGGHVVGETRRRIARSLDR